MLTTLQKKRQAVWCIKAPFQARDNNFIIAPMLSLCLETLQVQLYIFLLDKDAVTYMQPSIHSLNNLIIHTNIYYINDLRNKELMGRHYSPP